MLNVVKTPTRDLRIGMYVSELDRPWLGTPFLLQGFQIENDKELQQLREICDYVFVDFQQSSVAPRPSGPSSDRAARQRENKKKFLESRRKARYADKAPLAEELPSARKAFATLSDSVGKMFRSTQKGVALDIEQVKLSVEPMIESICRNPDACIWLARLKQQDNYTYQHSVAASVWSVALGRQIGLAHDDLQSLAVGGLLFDVGKLEVDQTLLQSNRRLSGAELHAMRHHVQHGERMVQDLDISAEVRSMVLHHHERHNGSGYPNGLAGDQIPVFARIAAVVDVFDAMTSHRTYARGVSPTEAIRVLNDSRDTLFQAEIVDEFIQAVGVYPAGTLVMLSTGEVGVVVSEGRTRRLRPRVMILLDAHKSPVTSMRTIDLRDTVRDDQGKPLDIVTSLEADAYGLDLNTLAL